MTQTKQSESPVESAQRAVEAARNSLASLNERREQIGVRKIEIAAERQRLAHAALAEGDKEASEQLKALTSENVLLGEDLSNMSAAIAGAQKKIAEAEAREKVAQDVSNARKARSLVILRQDIAKVINKNLNSLSEGFGAYIMAGRELEGLTGRHVNRAANQYALTQSLLFALSPLVRAGFIQFEAPEREMRKPLAALAEIADRTHVTWIEKVLLGREDAPSSDEVESIEQEARSHG